MECIQLTEQNEPTVAHCYIFSKLIHLYTSFSEKSKLEDQKPEHHRVYLNKFLTPN